MIYLTDGICKQCEKESDALNVETRLCIKCTALNLLDVFGGSTKVKTENTKLIEVDYESKKCPDCDMTIDISVDYAFENNICPYCGFGIKK